MINILLPLPRKAQGMLLPAVYLFLPVLPGAQPVITKSETFTTERNIYVEGLQQAPNSDNFFLVYRTLGDGLDGRTTKKVKWAVDLVSPEMKMVSRGRLKRIDFPDGDIASWAQVVHFGQEVSLLFFQFEKKDDRVNIYRSAIGPNGSIGELTRIGGYYSGNGEGSERLQVQSPDSALLLLALYPPAGKKKEPISYIVFDREWKQVREGILQMPNMNAAVLFKPLILQSDGTVWMPVWVKEDDDDGAVRQEVWRWKDTREAPRRIDVSLAGDRLITDMKLAHAPPGSEPAIYLGGVYAAASKKAVKAIFSPPEYPLDHNPEQGTFYQKLDPGGKILSRSVQPFDTATYHFYRVEPDEVKKGGGINSVSIHGVYPQTDGRVWVDEGNEQTVVTRYNTNGTVEQEVVLPYSVWTSIDFDKSGGHFAGFQGSKAVFLYNTHRDNFREWPDRYGHVKTILLSEKMNMGFKKIASGVLSLGFKGQAELRELFTLPDTNYWLLPETAIELSPGHYMMACQGQFESYGLVRIDF